MAQVTKVNIRNLPEEEFFYGHKACPGCGGSLAVRLAMKVLGSRALPAVPANCMSAVSFYYPVMNFTTNGLAGTFPGTASILTGIEAGAKSLGWEDCPVVGFAGDGGTADIGLQALSGAIDRNDHIIYVCYDNEAYMNTGIQESSLTPYGMKTTTSPAGNNIHGCQTHKKNMFEIVAAHGIAYAATASVGYPQDFMNKIAKAKENPGTSYIHVMAPCPTGWGVPMNETISIAKKAVDTGLWYLAEYENGEFKLNRDPKTFIPVGDYLLKQSRFKHLDENDLHIIEAERERVWERIRTKW